MAAPENKQHKEEPIIIKMKHGRRKGGFHGGAWKVAYADFVTAMMAFFIVMWILGQSDQIKQNVVSFFKDPGAFSFMTGKRTIPVDLHLNPKESGKADSKGRKKSDFFFMIPPEQKDTIVNKAAENLKKLALDDSAKAAEKLKQMGEEFRKYLNQQMQSNPELKELLTSIKIEMTKEGLRIELIETKESVFFEIGSAKIKDKAREVLIRLAKEIGTLPNYVDIEGHTDSRKYSDKAAYTNWELSADRANSARRLLEQKGFWEGQVERVTGFADRKLRNPGNPFDISNRRITILIRQLSSTSFIKQN